MSVWFLARGAGLAALVLLSATICLGALVSRHGRPEHRYVVQYLHRVTGGLGLVVLAVHITAILSDSFAHVGWRGALVPFLSGYRPGWVALGTFAAYLFLVTGIVGLARGRMATSPLGARVWRGLHALAYAGWASAMWHGFLTGTDSDVGWVRVLYLVCLGAVVGSVSMRLAALRGRPAPRREAPVAGHREPAAAGAQR